MKYAALDLHQETTAVCVRDSQGVIVHRAVVPTTRRDLRDSLRVVRAPLTITVEQGSLASWAVRALARPAWHVIVCDPRRNDLLKHGSKTDRLDAERLSELLRLGAISPVYVPDAQMASLREIVHHHYSMVRDATILQLRIRSLIRREATPAVGDTLFSRRYRKRWIQRSKTPMSRLRLSALYLQLDLTQSLRREAERAIARVARVYPAYELLQSIPCIGPLRAAVIVATIATPERFASRRQLWAYAGLAVRMRGSGEHYIADGQPVRNPKALTTRGLNRNGNPHLKRALVSAATHAARISPPMKAWFDRAVDRGLTPQLARIALARKIASIAFAMWKSGEVFEPERFAAVRS
jgi:transposase